MNDHFIDIQLKAAQQWLHEQIEISAKTKWIVVMYWHCIRTNQVFVIDRNYQRQDPNYVTLP